MRCPVCDTIDNWESLKELHSKKELQCCKKCGFVGFKIEEGEEEKMLDYYKHQYRPAPGHGNLVTTSHKQNYILSFLREFLEGKKGLVTGDVGCATGYLVAFMRRIGHKATGCEYTLTFRRFSEHFYGIPVTEELKEDIKYDLITIYHVLEHMIDPDKKLEKYRSLLNENGHMLISTPQWYDTLEEASGPQVTSFENLWHENHINAFSEKNLKSIFKKVGLEVVKEDHFVYGQTYLVKKCNPKPLNDDDFEKPEDKIALTKKAHKAIELFVKGQFKEAKDLWPRFPDAYINLIMGTFGKDQDRQEDTWKEAFEVLPNSKKLKQIYSMVYLFQRARYGEAIKIIDELVKVCNDEEKMMVLGQCFALIGDHKRAMNCFFKASDMNPLKWQVAMDFMGKEASLMPAWDEIELEKVANEAAKEAKAKITLKDPIFETNGEEKKLEVVK